MDLSKSPQRNTFQKEGYLRRCQEEGKEPDKLYLAIYEKNEMREEEWAQEGNHDNDLEWDLRTTDWILEKVRSSDTYAQNLYAALCNNDFLKLAVVPILRQDPDKDFWSCSWRHAGGIIADMRREGDYIDWYCSGINDGGTGGIYENGYVAESIVTATIREDLKKLRWIVKDKE